MTPRTLVVTLATALLAVAVAACDFSDEGGPRVEASTDAGELPGDADDRFSIHSTDRSVKLGLTDEVVYMRLSDELLRRADREMNEKAGEREGLAGTITAAVTGAVSKALRTRISFEHEDVRDIRWEDGRLVVELETGDRAFGDMEVEDEDVTDKFAERDVRAFVEEWRKVKGDAAGGGEGDGSRSR